MPDLQAFTITAGTTGNVSVPRFTISGRIVHSKTGALLADFTGGAALQFPAVLTQLSAADREELIQMVATWLMLKRWGGQ